MNIQEYEVEWYNRNGKHPERIALDKTGKQYVIGDWSWNRMCANGKREFVEPYMLHESKQPDAYRIAQRKDDNK